LTVSSTSREGHVENHDHPGAIVGEYPFTLALMQFSSSVEVGKRGTPAAVSQN
jgi:hypothetical protein